MNNLLRILSGLWLLSLCACQKELGIELPYEGDRLVIFGLITPDSIVSVKINKTAPPTGIFLYGDSVANATVELFEDGAFVELLSHKGKSIYYSLSGFKPISGKSYHLKVSAPGFPPAETSPQMVPMPVKLEGYVFRDTISSPFSENARRLSFTFTDNTPGAAFYYAGIVGQYKGMFVALNTFVADRPLEASEDLCSFRSEDNQYVLQDVCFNGQPFTYHLGVSPEGFLQGQGPRSINDTIRGKITCDRILLRFRKITRAYRDYLYKAGWDEEGFLRAFTLPTPEYTNIQGGYGIWAAYSEEVADILK